MGNIYDTDANDIDSSFERNYKKCVELNIPVGIYVYNYCNSIGALKKGVEYVVKKLNGKKLNLPIYLDMEDKTIIKEGKSALTNQCIEFCKLVRQAGYEAGVYANVNWFKNYIDASKLNCSIWVAQYYKECEYKGKYDIWQYSSSGTVNGISSKNVDMNYLYNEKIIKKFSSKKSNEVIAQEVIDGKWKNGKERKEMLEKAGYNYEAIQQIVNEKLSKKSTSSKKSNETVAKEVIAGKWGNGSARKTKLEKAGYNYETIQEIVNKMMK